MIEAMGNQNNGTAYFFLKWTWLAFQALVLPLSAIYLTSPMSHPIIVPFSRIALYLLGAAFIIFWIMAQSLLSMYRFPLVMPPALSLVSGQFLQIILTLFVGNSLTFVLYMSFFSSMTALLILTLIVFGWKLLVRPLRWYRLLMLVIVAGLAFCFMGVFLGPLLSGFSELRSGQIALDIVAMAANIGFTVHRLYGFSIFARPGKLDRSFDREWQRWAPRTFIMLTLSIIAAVTISGVRGM